MRIVAFLSKLFNVRSGEWRRLLLLYCMSLAVVTGLTWADAIVQADFLQRVGVQYLPWVFISSAACSIGAMFVYSAFADRVSNTRLLIALLAIGGAGLLLGLAALASGLVGLATCCCSWSSRCRCWTCTTSIGRPTSTVSTIFESRSASCPC